MAKWFLDHKLETQLEIIRDKMQNTLKSGDSYLNGSLDYLFLGGGKMLRPALLLIGSRFGKQNKKHEEHLIELATAIETLHMATLIHDDVIDEAHLRRGVESIQSRYGKEYAVYMGDYLLSQCFLLLTELQIPRELAIRLARVVTKICIGEIKQNTNRYNLDISPMEYFRIVAGKTASLFAIALSAGAYINNTPEREIKKLAYIGFQLGMAFQLVDDILDFTGKEEEVGKDLKKDLLRGYYSMPVIFALSKDFTPSSTELRGILAGDLKDVSIAVDLINKSGAIEETKNLARRYHNRGRALILKLPKGSGQDLLLGVLPKLIERIN